MTQRRTQTTTGIARQDLNDGRPRLGPRSSAGTGSGPARPFARLVSLDPEHQREGVVDRLKLLRVETAA